MEEKIFREFINLIKDLIWQEFSSSESYRELFAEKVKASDAIIKLLGSDVLMDEYLEKQSDIEVEYQYFLCKSVIRAFAEIMSAAGII